MAAATRKRVREATPETSSEETSLQAALQEIRSLREEQQRSQAEYIEALQLRDSELRQLRGRLRESATQQISPSGPSGERAVFASARIPFCADSGVKLKPDIFDGSVPWREFFSQFSLIARANCWDEGTKTVVLVSCLRGKARAVLESVLDLENLEFAELKSKLELRFGESQSFQDYYSQFINRKQKFGENLASFGFDVERLSQLAYPECTYDVRDKIACAQFVSALSDGFVKRTLQLEGVTSLGLAVERAKAVKAIQENCFEKKKENNFNFYGRRENDCNFAKRSGNSFRGAENRFAERERVNEKFVKDRFGKNNKNKFDGKARSGNRGECWLCGKAGHFRSECPGKSGNKA